MRKLLCVLGLLFAAVIGVALADRPLPRADLTYIDLSDFKTLDPQRMSYMQDNRLCYAIYEGLVRWDNFSEDFHVEPALARSWDISPDGLVYTFHLEPTARWSNGEPVTARDFAYAWQRIMIPDAATDYTASIFFRIKGAREYFDWRSAQLEEYRSRPAASRTQAAAEELRRQSDERYRASVGVEPLDDHTLRVTLALPTPYFLDLLAFSSTYPVHPPTVEKWVHVDADTGAIRQGHEWTKPPLIVTNGPYIVKSWKFKREMRLAANPHYWNPSVVKSKTVSILPIDSENTSVLAFKTGAADWHSDTDVEYVADMIEQKKAGLRDDIHPVKTFGTYFWGFNCTPRLTDGRPNPFHSAGVRRAFAMAIDKQALASTVKRSGEEPTNVLVPEGTIPGFKSPKGLFFDIARARQELAAAGWSGRNADGVPTNAQGEAFPVVEMLVTNVQFHRDTGLVMGRMIEEAFGIKTKLVVKETKAYADDLDRRDYMMARAGWYGDYGDPTTFLLLHKTGDGNNDRGYSNSKFDAMLDAADREPDPEKRMRILEEAERYTMEEELPVLPLWRYNHYYLFHPPTKPDGTPNPGGLSGWSPSPRLVQYLWKMEVVR